MISTNSKVNRTLSTIALIVKDLPDDKIQELHNAINDKEDGYRYDFKQAVNSYRISTLNQLNGGNYVGAT